MRVYKEEKLLADNSISASRKHFVGDAMMHGHNFFEIEYVIDGKGVYEIDGKSYPIKTGMLFFMTPANVHTLNSADAELINVMFKSGGEILPFDVSGVCISATELLDDDRPLVFELLSEIVKVQNKDVAYSRLLLKCVFQKLCDFYRQERVPSDHYALKTITYIMENFRNGITLEEVADNVGLSKAYLSDYFVRQTGINFKNYLDNVRFDYVKTLLEFTDTPIGEIYSDAGFGDYANFSRRFKKKYGVSPTEYRNKIKRS